MLNDQATIGLHSAERLLALAEGGLRIFVVGKQPAATTGAEPDAERLAGVIESLLAQPTVIRSPVRPSFLLRCRRPESVRRWRRRHRHPRSDSYDARRRASPTTSPTTARARRSSRT